MSLGWIAHRGDDMSTEQQNIELARRAVQAFNDRDRGALVGCYADQWRMRTGEGPDDYVLMDEESHWASAKDWIDGLDLRCDELEIVAADDRVFSRWRYHGRHLTTVRGVEPTGEPFSVEAWQAFTVEDGRIVEEQAIMDMLGLYMALGVVELPPPADG